MIILFFAVNEWVEPLLQGFLSSVLSLSLVLSHGLLKQSTGRKLLGICIASISIFSALVVKGNEVDCSTGVYSGCEARF